MRWTWMILFLLYSVNLIAKVSADTHSNRATLPAEESRQGITPSELTRVCSAHYKFSAGTENLLEPEAGPLKANTFYMRYYSPSEQVNYFVTNDKGVIDPIPTGDDAVYPCSFAGLEPPDAMCAIVGSDKGHFRKLDEDKAVDHGKANNVVRSRVNFVLKPDWEKRAPDDRYDKVSVREIALPPAHQANRTVARVVGSIPKDSNARVLGPAEDPPPGWHEDKDNNSGTRYMVKNSHELVTWKDAYKKQGWDQAELPRIVPKGHQLVLKNGAYWSIPPQPLTAALCRT